MPRYLDLGLQGNHNPVILVLITQVYALESCKNNMVLRSAEYNWVNKAALNKYCTQYHVEAHL